VQPLAVAASEDRSAHLGQPVLMRIHGEPHAVPRDPAKKRFSRQIKATTATVVHQGPRKQTSLQSVLTATVPGSGRGSHAKLNTGSQAPQRAGRSVDNPQWFGAQQPTPSEKNFHPPRVGVPARKTESKIGFGARSPLGFDDLLEWRWASGGAWG